MIVTISITVTITVSTIITIIIAIRVIIRFITIIISSDNVALTPQFGLEDPGPLDLVHQMLVHEILVRTSATCGSGPPKERFKILVLH